MPGKPEDCDVAADWLASWSELTHDAGTFTSSWFWIGAPAGIPQQTDMGPVFPLATEPDPDDLTTLDNQYDPVRVDGRRGVLCRDPVFFKQIEYCSSADLT